jgi:hypothetical protein
VLRRIGDKVKGQIIGYRQLEKDGRFHMALVAQGLLLPRMPWDWRDP